MPAAHPVPQSSGLPAGRSSVGTAWALWALFIVYGSLVPLAYTPLPWAEALAAFARTPWLQLDAERRADWISNAVLYVPLGWLSVLWWAGRSASLARRLVAAVLALVSGCALAVSVEFTQLYFPLRTVSLNDLLAEVLGSAIGALIGLRWTAGSHGVLAAAAGRMRLPLASAPALFGLAYAAWALFPYDLVLSMQELAGKQASASWGWLLAPAGHQEAALRRVARLVAEALTLAPLGWLWARRRAAAGRSVPWPAALALGAAFGLTLELAQFFLVSGVSQGVSALTRALGVVVGVWAWQRGRGLSAEGLRTALAPWTWPALALLAVLLAALSGWFASDWRTPDQAWARISGGEIRFVPFFYHYYLPESVAVFSLSAVALAYAPVGVLGWARRWTAGQGAFAAALVATLIELGKLFPLALRPDPTNVLIAAGAAWLVGKLLAASQGSVADSVALAGPVAPPFLRPAHGALAAAAALTAGWVSGFPVAPLALGAMLVAALALVWWRPVLVFALVGAGLPLLDLAHWSGRTLVDEYDMLLLIGLAAAFVRTPATGRRLMGDRRLLLLMTLMTAVMLLSALPGVATWAGATLREDFSNPIHPLNGLRVAKGAVWALLLCVLARRLLAARQDVHGAFAVGVRIGLAGTVAAIFWERAAFTSVLDFADVYRVAGPLSAMYTGGAYIEGFLAVGLVYAGAWLLQTPRWSARAAALLLVVGATYSLSVTLSRAGWAAGAVGLVVLALMSLRRPQRPLAAAALVLTLLGTMVAVAWPILAGPAGQQRLSTIQQDLEVREAHWTRAWTLHGGGLHDWLLGIGLGAFPAANYWASPAERRPAVHAFLYLDDGRRAGHTGQLRLGPGWGLYIDQVLAVEPGQTVRVQVSAAARALPGTLGFSLCHKWVLSSFDCVAGHFKVEPGAGAARAVAQNSTQTASLATGPLGGDAWPWRRNVRFTLHHAGGAVIDVDRVSLKTADGRELLDNGGFEHGADRWSFTSDDHLAWHVKNFPLTALLETGLLGVLAFAGLIGLALVRGARAAWAADARAAVPLAALIGLLGLGFFDSVIDAPRFLLLLGLLCWLCASGAHDSAARAEGDPRGNP